MIPPTNNLTDLPWIYGSEEELTTSIDALLCENASSECDVALIPSLELTSVNAKELSCSDVQTEQTPQAITNQAVSETMIRSWLNLPPASDENQNMDTDTSQRSQAASFDAAAACSNQTITPTEREIYRFPDVPANYPSGGLHCGFLYLHSLPVPVAHKLIQMIESNDPLLKNAISHLPTEIKTSLTRAIHNVHMKTILKNTHKVVKLIQKSLTTRTTGYSMLRRILDTEFTIRLTQYQVTTLQQAVRSITHQE